MTKRKVIAGSVAILASLLFWSNPSPAHNGFTLESVKGRWGGSEESVVSGVPGFAVTLFTFDGAGGCTVTYSESGGGSPMPQDFNEEPFACQYTIDRHGKGTITGGGAPVRFVLTQHGKLIRYALCCARGFSGRGEMNRM